MSRVLAWWFISVYQLRHLVLLTGSAFRRDGRATKEMITPCLLHLHVISLVALAGSALRRDGHAACCWS